MPTLKEHPARSDAAASPKLAYNEHLRACPQCFRATARGELCPQGVPMFDALPPVAAPRSAPHDSGSYGFEGLDDSMTFPSQGSPRPRRR